MDWNQQKVLVTGGASFISSHLIDQLVAKGARSIRVVDDLTSGRLANIQAAHRRRHRRVSPGGPPRSPASPSAWSRGSTSSSTSPPSTAGAATSTSTRPPAPRTWRWTACWSRPPTRRASRSSSSPRPAASTPTTSRATSRQELYLTEEMVGPPYDADNMYGWAKLMAEMTLRAYARDFGFKSASCRFFTVYGERGVENHAVIAMIARAFVRQDPFEVWGDGTQIRNWTYVGDIVSGMVARRREDRRRHGRQPRHRGAHARDRRRPRGAALHRPGGRDQAPPPHADRPAQPRGEQPPGQASSSAGSRR